VRRGDGVHLLKSGRLACAPCVRRVASLDPRPGPSFRTRDEVLRRTLDQIRPPAEAVKWKVSATAAVVRVRRARRRGPSQRFGRRHSPRDRLRMACGLIVDGSGGRALHNLESWDASRRSSSTPTRGSGW
jgi:hypothetical protein